MKESGEEIVFLVEKKEMALRCPLQLASEHRSNEFLKFVVKTKIVERVWELERKAWKKHKCAGVTRNMCLRWPMEQAMRNRR